MRPKLRKRLEQCFSGALEKRLPQFTICQDDRNPQGELVWAWELAHALTFFVLLNIADDYDDFAIEVAWSDDRAFPWRAFGDRFEKIAVPKYRQRLSFLWVTGKWEFRWEIVRRQTYEEVSAKIAAQKRGDYAEARRIEKLIEVPTQDALLRVPPLVNDAVHKLDEFGISLFRKVAEIQGVKWPVP
jgi:hypothetical protein